MFELHKKYRGPVRALSCALAVALAVGACGTVVPMSDGPTVAVLPGGGKGMPEFNKDDIACRDTAKLRAHDNTPLPVAMGLGRVEVASSRARVTVRDRTEDTVSVGSAFGNAAAPDTALVTAQQRYDTAYVQCMFAKGHKIPIGDALSS